MKMTKLSFVLSLSKDSLRARRSCFDKLSTNAVTAFLPPRLRGGGTRVARDGGGALLNAEPAVGASPLHRFAVPLPVPGRI